MSLKESGPYVHTNTPPARMPSQGRTRSRYHKQSDCSNSSRGLTGGITGSPGSNLSNLSYGTNETGSSSDLVPDMPGGHGEQVRVVVPIEKCQCHERTYYDNIRDEDLKFEDSTELYRFRV